MLKQKLKDRDIEAVTALVNRLQSKDATIRASSAQELSLYVATLSRELSSETFSRFLSDLTPMFQALLQSDKLHDQLGGVAAVDALISVATEAQIIRFANYLRSFFVTCEHKEALYAASVTLGKLASTTEIGISGTLVAAFVDFEVKRAFEWLSNPTAAFSNGHRRLAACFVLKQLAISVPTLFHVNLPTFFVAIWTAIRDSRVYVREAATEALSSCLQLIAMRQTRHRVQWYCKIYDQVQEGFHLSITGSHSRNSVTCSTSSLLKQSSSSLNSTIHISNVALNINKTTTSWESVHGSLLVVGELLQNTGNFMVPRFRECCDTVLLYKEAKDKLVGKAVCILLPQLAEYCPDAFVRYYLITCMSHLMKRIINSSHPSDRGIAFLSLGKIALAVKEHIMAQLPQIVELIKENMISNKKRSRNKSYCIETLTCIASLTIAVGDKFKPYLHDLLELMMEGGLNDPLIEALSKIVNSVPSFLAVVQERLLNEISLILRGIPFSATFGSKSAVNTVSEKRKQTTMPNQFQSLFMTSSKSPTQPAMSRDEKGVLITGENNDEIELILLSLKTLSWFNFSGNFCLLPFVKECVALYLENSESTIRKQAVVTSTKLLLPMPQNDVSGGAHFQSSNNSSSGNFMTLATSSNTINCWRHVTKRGPSGRVIDEVVQQILQVGIADSDSSVRKSVVESLDTRFDDYLSQEKHLLLLFHLLNDEITSIRQLAMKVLERLVSKNPAFIMPLLRQVLIQLLTELEYTCDKRMMEDSTVLLGCLIKGSQHLIEPYLNKILQVLLPKLQYGNANLASAVLGCVGELAIVSQDQMVIYEPYLLPLIIETLQDHSSIQKRQMALKTLGQLAGSTGCVIRPYLGFPKLLEILLDLLQHSATSPWQLRREAMKTIGILGALDPYKYKLCVSRASLREDNEEPNVSAGLINEASLSTSRNHANGMHNKSFAEKSQQNKLQNQALLPSNIKSTLEYSKLNKFDFSDIHQNSSKGNSNVNFSYAMGNDIDEKQQVELQLFTAAPVGTRRLDKTRSKQSVTKFKSEYLPSANNGAVEGNGNTAVANMNEEYFEFECDQDLELDPRELSPSAESYFPTVAIHALLTILKEPSLSMHHHGVIQAIMFIFKSLSLQCVPFLKYILPPFLKVLSRCEPRLRESLFLQLTTLTSIVTFHLKPFFRDMMRLALRFWRQHLPQIIRLVEKISKAAPKEFKTEFFPQLLPLLLEVLQPHPHPELFIFDGIHLDGTTESAGTSTTTSTASVSVVGVASAVGGSSANVIGSGTVGSVGSGAGGVAGGVGNSSGDGGVNLKSHGLTHASGSVVNSSTLMDGINTLPLDLSKNISKIGIVASIQIQVLHAIIIFQSAVEDYVYVLVPSLMSLLENEDTAIEVKTVLTCLVARMCLVSKCAQYAGARIMQPLARMVRYLYASPTVTTINASNSYHTLKMEYRTLNEMIIYALCCILYQLQDSFSSFIPLADDIINNFPSNEMKPTEMITYFYDLVKLMQQKDRITLQAIQNNTLITTEIRQLTFEDSTTSPILPNLNNNNATRLHVNQQNLRRAWEASQRSTKEDWLEWMRRFSIELLRESPSAALRSCCSLAQAYNPLARALFNPAFVSCWNELYEQYQDYLVRALETAFQSDTIPAEILQTLLNLAEFMEHDVEALPIDIRELGELAQKCHAYAKALHYKELEFHTSPSTCIESLISINNQVGQPEAAVGILKYAQQHHKSVIQVKETWFEKLHNWHEALELYNLKLNNMTKGNPNSLDLEVCIGKMRCLEAIGEWEQLAELAQEAWKFINKSNTEKVKPDGNSAISNDSQTSIAKLNGASTSNSSQSSSKLIIRASSLSGTMLATTAFGEEVENPLIKRVAMLGARASWWLSQWDTMEQYVKEFNQDGSDALCCLYQSVLAVHHNRFEDAQKLIDGTRKALDTKLGALVGESYLRAYRTMVTLQQLSELEEIITYKKLRLQLNKSDEAARCKLHILRMWQNRLNGCKRVVEVWQQLLAVRSLILSPQEDTETWLQFASLCRQSGNLTLSLKVFTNALHVNTKLNMDTMPKLSLHTTILNNNTTTTPVNSNINLNVPHLSNYNIKDQYRVTFAYLKHLWAVGDKVKALTELQKLVSHITRQNSLGLPNNISNMNTNNGNLSGSGGSKSIYQEEEIVVKCHLKLAEWQLAIHEQQLDRVSVPNVLSSLKLSTELEPNSYKAWHEWALMNFHVVEYFSQLQSNSLPPTPNSKHKSKNSINNTNAGANNIGPYIAPAIEGFFRSIALGRSRWAANVQQDILRVLTLWFAHGHRSDVHSALVAGFSSVSIETWLIVIPQLIARIHTPYPRIQTQLHRLLCTIGAQHPHALIYPLSVALKSPLQVRQLAAEAIMSTMRRHYVELVDEALLVSRELIRVAILWHEMWHEGLEEASRLYFNEHDVDGMVAVLQPLHQMMEQGPETLREVSFHQAFGRDLREAYEWIQRYLLSLKTSNIKNESDLNRAWDLYYHVFRRINKQLPQLTTLELQYVSPNLLNANNLQLAVPGTYRAGHAIVKIGSFVPTIHVITSKQRPRRITIVGTNGLEYMFLLKGHEDLRQDERVTQLFGLVNALLINDRNTSKKDLKIHRYPVIPLSHNAGIVGWVPHCDTLHQLIRDYREARKILLNIEHRLMLQMAPDYDSLHLLQKVEVFEYALENTAGQDLYKVLWLKSENSEIWLDRRTNYTRSLAVMSMVGYILGLGDRHPSNLMLHRFSGTIVHIDFGDCFEVAMHREKYPEKIPFRLTRMLTNAMEVSGIEGNFRYSCESVMQVLRENRHSLMAMLEAFVHDPLICWRLLAPNASPATREKVTREITEGDANVSNPATSPTANTIEVQKPTKLHVQTADPSQVCMINLPQESNARDLITPQHRENSKLKNGQVSSAVVDDAHLQNENAVKNHQYNIKNDMNHAHTQAPSSVTSDKSIEDTAITKQVETSTTSMDETTAAASDQSVSNAHAIPKPKRKQSASINMPPLHASISTERMSKSIAFSRNNSAMHNANNTDITKPVQRRRSVSGSRPPQHENVNVHLEISTLAASVSEVGQGSLSRSLMTTAAELANQTNEALTAQVPTATENSIQGENEGNVETSNANQNGARASQSASQSQSKSDLRTNRSHRERELVHALGPEGAAAPREALNEKAVAVIRRVQSKLTGRDFENERDPLDVAAQVQRLINQAASHENLCQCYIGWCPFW